MSLVSFGGITPGIFVCVGKRMDSGRSRGPFSTLGTGATTDSTRVGQIVDSDRVRERERAARV